MILSRKLLQKYIPDLDKVSNDELFKCIISIGLEVEQKIEILQGEYLIIGQVLEITQHTYSPDKLVCTIKIKSNDKGDEKIITVCEKKMLGDKKIINKYVIVALSGCEIDGKIVVEKDIKGIISEGIICTYNQLIKSKYSNKMFEKENDEIVILDYGNVGDSHTDKYIAMDDCLFDVTLPHNRNELHGVKYIAYELSANLKLKFTSHEEPLKWIKKKQKNASVLPSFINQTNDTDLFVERVCLTCKNIADSPWILKGMLLNNHIQPGNLIENICHLITILTGVPLFLCDLNKIHGDIFIKTAKNKLIIIDDKNKKYSIDEGDLILVDGNNKVIALAGICVNHEVKVDTNSKSILIIFGNYDGSLLAKTTDRLNIDDNVSTKGINRIQCSSVVDELKSLVDELKNDENRLAIADIAVPDLCHKKYGKKIKITYKDIINFIGFKIAKREIKKKLVDLGFKVRPWAVFSPSYRTDINGWQDVVEEIIKAVDINCIPQIMIKSQTILKNDTHKYDKINAIIRILTDLQFTNVITKNLCSYQDAIKFDFFGYRTPLKLNIQANNSYLRLSLTDRLLKVLEDNNKMKTDLVPIFEIQKISHNLQEEHHLGVLLPTKIFPITWKKNDQLLNDIFLAKGIAKKIISAFGFECEFKKVNNRWMEENNSLEIYVYNNLIGYTGLISKELLAEYGLNLPVYCIELNIEQLLSSINTNIDKKREMKISNFQKITKDITISFTKDQPNQTFSFLKNVINQMEEMETWKLISVFHEEASVSYTIRYNINQQFIKERTSEEINLIIARINQKLLDHGFRIK